MEIRWVSLRSLLYLSSYKSVCFSDMIGVDFISSISYVVPFSASLTKSHLLYPNAGRRLLIHSLSVHQESSSTYPRVVKHPFLCSA